VGNSAASKPSNLNKRRHGRLDANAIEASFAIRVGHVTRHGERGATLLRGLAREGAGGLGARARSGPSQVSPRDHLTGECWSGVERLEAAIADSDEPSESNGPSATGTLHTRPRPPLPPAPPSRGCSARPTRGHRRPRSTGEFLLRTPTPLVHRGRRAGLRAIAAGRRGLARPPSQAASRPAADVPPPRGAHPQACIAVLARAAADPHRRERHQRHLAQPSPRAAQLAAIGRHRANKAGRHSCKLQGERLPPCPWVQSSLRSRLPRIPVGKQRFHRSTRNQDATA
jgi:hypothetical protein